jgi:hypothetical protein
VANCDNCGAPLRLDLGGGLLVCDHAALSEKARQEANT